MAIVAQQRGTAARLAPATAPRSRSCRSRRCRSVAIVLIGLVVAIATNSHWALDFFHVVGGGMWTALDLFLGLVLGPIMGTMSIAARMEFSSRLMPKMLLLMPTLVTMTLGSGFQLARKLGNLVGRLPPPRLARRLLHRRRRDGDDRARPARAGEHRGAVRDAQAGARTASGSRS